MTKTTARKAPAQECVALEGILDETKDLVGLIGPIQTDSLRLDCERITRINSAGARKWIIYFQSLRREGVSLVFACCPPSVVALANELDGFIQADEMESLMVPFLCGGCGNEIQELHSAAELKAAAFRLTPPRCASCGSPTRLDDIPDQYFALLKDSQ